MKAHAASPKYLWLVAFGACRRRAVALASCGLAAVAPYHRRLEAPNGAARRVDAKFLDDEPP
jgi:hypothetical protein